MSLSDKEVTKEGWFVYPKKDVEEAIKELKEYYCFCKKKNPIKDCTVCLKFEEIFGNKLLDVFVEKGEEDGNV